MVDENDAHAAQLHDDIVPFLGERVATMFAFAVADGFPAPDVAAPYRREIEESGDDPFAPQVTEAERLLLEITRAGGLGQRRRDQGHHHRENREDEHQLDKGEPGASHEYLSLNAASYFFWLQLLISSSLPTRMSGPPETRSYPPGLFFPGNV